MAEYISTADMDKRLTPQGVEWVADRDQSGSGVSVEEETLYVYPAIVYAGQIVDVHVQGRTTIAEARASGNQWLKDRCLDLAIEYALETGGRNVPESVAARAALTLEWLADHKAGNIDIPGYDYPVTSAAASHGGTRGPRVFNPRRPDR